VVMMVAMTMKKTMTTLRTSNQLMPPMLTTARRVLLIQASTALMSI
jgi:hypothetical protein